MVSRGDKKILIISALDVWSIGKNVGAQSLWRTLEGYVNVGWGVIFITGSKGAQGKPVNNEEFPFKQLKIVRFDCKLLKKLSNLRKIGFFATSLWWFYFQLQSIFKGILIARKEKIDVFYGYEVDGVIAAKVLSIIFKKPVVSRFQGTLLSRYLSSDERLWKLKFWWHVLALKTKTDLLIMANDGTRGDLVLKKLGAGMSKVKFWVNGVDKDLFNGRPDNFQLRKKLKFSSKDKILLSVSRLERWKRVDRTIRALPHILEKIPSVKFVVIGEGSDRKYLEETAKKFGVEKDVIFLGGIPHNKLGDYYNVADIFVSMYDISNVGNPLLEAMSSGKCVVALDVGDTNKFILTEENGVLVKKPSPEELTGVLTKLFNDEDKRRRLGYNAKRFADKHIWSWQQRLESEVNEVQNLLV
ncbi:MAG TPA: glycosyltransferase family 4 protein [Candidatus Nanoarchaeia archaeon]